MLKKGRDNTLILTDDKGNDIVITKALFTFEGKPKGGKRSATKPPSIRRTLFRLAQAGDEQVSKWLWDNFSLRVLRQEEIDEINRREEEKS